MVLLFVLCRSKMGIMDLLCLYVYVKDIVIKVNI